MLIWKMTNIFPSNTYDDSKEGSGDNDDDKIQTLGSHNLFSSSTLK